MPLVFVLILARFIGWLARVTNRGSGSAAPGLVVERFKPSFLADSMNRLPEGSIIITGTNGKTTTTKMVVELLESEGKRVLTNKSGSNFTRGIMSTLVKHTNLKGELDFDIAVLELDEAYSPQIAKQIKPKLVLALNVHRDQLDRYGEVDSTAQMIGEAMNHSKLAVVNGDDPLLVKTAQGLSNAPSTGFFGISSELINQMPTDDELHGEQEQQRRKVPVEIELVGYKKGSISINVRGKTHTTAFKMPGIYNAVNATAAVLAILELYPSINPQSLVYKLAEIEPAFGRGERFIYNNRKLLFGLVKNPAGFNHNLKTMLEGADSLLIAANDNYADGRDVSWFWDVDFASHAEKLNKMPVFVSGVRANDMALRLQQDGIKAVVKVNIDEALKNSVESVSTDQNIVIMPTYTAMLELRALLAKEIEVPDIW